MGTRGNDQAPHQPLLSSLVVRPEDSDVGGDSDDDVVNYESGDVRRHQAPYSRHNRYDSYGYRLHAGSVSPMRHRDTNNRFSPGLVHPVDASRNHAFGNHRGSGRYRDFSPPYCRTRDIRFDGRAYDRSAHCSGPVRGEREGPPRNNPNVQPRDGDWLCSDPICNNLNFARRERCNNCNLPRHAASPLSPRRGYPRLLISPRAHVPSSTMDPSPRRMMNGGGYRSPPHSWTRDSPRDFRPSRQPKRHEGRFEDTLSRVDTLDYPDSDPRDRHRYDRPILGDWSHTDHGRNHYFNERRGYARRLLSPPPAPVAATRGWASDIRDRSRSPMRGGGPLPKDYHRDIYFDRRRGNHRVID